MTSVSDQFSLDPESVRSIIGKETKQVMVFGFASARYMHVIEHLDEAQHKIQKVFTYRIGEDIPHGTDQTHTAEGTKIIPVLREYGKNKAIARQCKTAISTLIVENYRRKKKGEPLIPLIFCVEYSGKTEEAKEFKTTSHQLTSREEDFNQLITHSELRRAFKLCKQCEQSEDPELRELAQIARETFKFVRVEQEDHGRHRLTQVDPIWTADDWESSWQERLKTHNIKHLPESEKKQFRWREQMVEMVREHNTADPEAVTQRLEVCQRTVQTLISKIDPTVKEEEPSTTKKKTEPLVPQERVRSLISMLQRSTIRSHVPSSLIDELERLYRDFPETNDRCFEALRFLAEIEIKTKIAVDERLQEIESEPQKNLRTALDKLDEINRSFKNVSESDARTPSSSRASTAVDRCTQNLQSMALSAPDLDRERDRLVRSFQELNETGLSPKVFIENLQKLVDSVRDFQRRVQLKEDVQRAKKQCVALESLSPALKAEQEQILASIERLAQEDSRAQGFEEEVETLIEASKDLNKRVKQEAVFKRIAGLQQLLIRALQGSGQAGEKTATTLDYEQMMRSIVKLLDSLAAQEPEWADDIRLLVGFFDHHANDFEECPLTELEENIHEIEQLVEKR